MYFKYLISVSYSKCSLGIIYSDCSTFIFQVTSAERQTEVKLASESQYLTGTSLGHFILVSNFDV